MSFTNKILLAIPHVEYQIIHSDLEPFQFRQHCILHEPTQRLEFAYFLNWGLITLLVATEDGKTVEVGMVGNEGVTGVAATVGLTISPLRQLVQIPGDGFRVKVSTLQNRLKSAPQLQMALSRYAVVQGMQVAQTAACNRLHDAGQRLARWLLMAADRAQSTSLPITHDFLATMLGTELFVGGGGPSSSAHPSGLETSLHAPGDGRAIVNWHRKQMDEPKVAWSPDLPELPDDEQRWFTQAEIKQIVDAATGQYKVLFHLAGFTGLRSGELCGLHVEDLKLEHGVIEVRRAVWNGIEGETKTKSGKRNVFPYKCFETTLLAVKPAGSFIQEEAHRWKTGIFADGFSNRSVKNSASDPAECTLSDMVESATCR
jgi:CRP-like cAMP-binding protein